MNKILITGASGYIGSCLFKYLIKKNFDVYGLDKKQLSIKELKNRFYHGNLNNKKFLNKLISFLNPDFVIHLAGESTLDRKKKKKKYIANNINATKTLISSMKINGIKNLIFSSTAAVYKISDINLKERSKISPNNIYGSTKLSCENLIIKNDYYINYIIFRFFNVCSAIPKLNVGELHSPETHLIPLTIHKLTTKKKLKVYGNDYQTYDGTCIRDYIHIFDLCLAFEKAINNFKNKNVCNNIFNLGSGKGYSVLEIIKIAVKKIKLLNLKNCLVFSNKRSGDNPRLVCNYVKAFKLLGWRPIKSNLNKIINDEIIWQKKIKKSRQFIY